MMGRGNTQRENAFLCQYFLSCPLQRPGVMWTNRGTSSQPGRAPEALSRVPCRPGEAGMGGCTVFQTGGLLSASGYNHFLHGIFLCRPFPPSLWPVVAEFDGFGPGPCRSGAEVHHMLHAWQRQGLAEALLLAWEAPAPACVWRDRDLLQRESGGSTKGFFPLPRKLYLVNLGGHCKELCRGKESKYDERLSGKPSLLWSFQKPVERTPTCLEQLGETGSA